MTALKRSNDVLMSQFRFLCENDSVAAAKTATSTAGFVTSGSSCVANLPGFCLSSFSAFCKPFIFGARKE